MKTHKYKKGISLIVLVITIIVMIILAAAIILSLSGSDIRNKAKEAVTANDISSANEIVAVAQSEWELNYEELKAEHGDFKTYVNKKIEQAEINNVIISNTGAVNVIYIDEKGDKAVVPEGFVVSGASGEDSIEEGLVIYEGKEAVTNKNVDDAQKTRNQFVWVPVEYNDINAYEDSNNNGLDDDFDNVFKRNNEYRGENYSQFTEPCSTIQTLSITNDTTLEWKEEMALRKSVAIYGGFYIGRYEAGTIKERSENTNNGTMDVFIQKNKYVYNHVGWSPDMTKAEGDVVYLKYNQGKGAVELSRNLYNNSSVRSHLIYGVEWDAVMTYISEDVDVIDSSTWGNVANYNDSVSENNKVDGAGSICNTGHSEHWKTKNIYDLAGNMYEWTMEARESGFRVARGGHMNSDGTISASSWNPGTSKFCVFSYGFRPALYIKE